MRREALAFPPTKDTHVQHPQNLGNFYEPTREICDEPSVSYQTNFVRVYTSEERRAAACGVRTIRSTRRFEQYRI